MLILSSGQKGEPCYECTGTGSQGPPGPHGPPGLPGKITSHYYTQTYFAFQIHIQTEECKTVSVAQALHMDQVLKEIRATQDREAYLEYQ